MHTPGMATVTAGAGTITARLPVAAGHGQRIAGRTQAALGIFTGVWEHGDGPVRLAAGLWAAALHTRRVAHAR
jgi:hypothetical protein